jgi:uridine phosphorylase
MNEVLQLGKSERGKLYRIGEKILSVSHGMGNPSCLIFLHELGKLLWHARVRKKEEGEGKRRRCGRGKSST